MVVALDESPSTNKYFLLIFSWVSFFSKNYAIGI